MQVESREHGHPFSGKHVGQRRARCANSRQRLPGAEPRAGPNQAGRAKAEAAPGEMAASCSTRDIPGRWRPRAPRATYPGRVCHAWQSGSHEYDRANAELVERPKEADVAEEDTKLQKEEERRRKGIIETAGDGEG